MFADVEEYITTDWLVGNDTTKNPQIGDEFSNFAAQKIGVECCLVAPLFDYNFADTGAVAAVNECFAIQRVLFSQNGRTFLELLTKRFAEFVDSKVDPAGIENASKAYLNLLATESVKPKIFAIYWAKSLNKRRYLTASFTRRVISRDI